jgi:hypothetical protein
MPTIGQAQTNPNAAPAVLDQDSNWLVEQACRCRRLAGATYDREICEALAALADDYERTAAGLRPA